MRIRKLLLIHPSRSARGLIKKYIFSELNDTEIHEAHNGKNGLEMLNAEKFDIILSIDRLKDISIQKFRTELDQTGSNGQKPLIIITENESENICNVLAESGFERVVPIRIRPSELILKINEACNPRAWRKDTRYHIPNVKVLINTPTAAIEANLINLSMGGLLVEFGTQMPDEIMKGNLNAAMQIPFENSIFKIEDLDCKLLRIEIVDWSPDSTPAIMRATFIFKNLATGLKNKLAELIQMAEQDKLSAVQID